jgi:hypothetical protein
MLPDVGAGTPLTATWFLASCILLGLTILAGLVIGLCMHFVNRAFASRDAADAGRDERLDKLDKDILEHQLAALDKNQEHQDKIHDMELKILECQRTYCAGAVRREEHQGDYLRLEHEVREMMRRLESKVEGLITRVHERIDGVVMAEDKK